MPQRSVRSVIHRTMGSLAVILLTSAPSFGEVTPGQIAVIANARMPESIAVAQSYLAARGVPKNNLIQLRLPTEETISREQYESELIAPLRQALTDRALSGKIRVLLPVYGVPLKVAAPEATAEEKQILLDALARQRLARGLMRQLVDEAQTLSGEKASLENDSDPALVAAMEQAVKAASRRIAALPAEEQRAGLQQLSELVERFGGFTAIVRNLKPKSEAQSAQAQASLQKMKNDIAAAEQMLGALAGTPSPENRQRAYVLTQRLYGAVGVLARANTEIAERKHEAADAALDSELTLLWWDRGSYSISGRLPNPLYFPHLAAKQGPALRLPVLMVSRLDAPTAAHARRLVRDALKAEQDGLHGTAYIDARGLKEDRKNEISIWDQNLRDFAWALRRETDYEVEADNSAQLLTEAPKTALYAGWYSLRSYHDVFEFVPGAIGFHIASEEAVSIRNATEKGWCKNMLERGVAATLGAVAEPYLDSFPLPRQFFGLLLSGRYSLVEAYFLSTRYISWRMVLFGDPLYNPWRGKPRMSVDEIALTMPDGTVLKNLPPAPGQLPMDDPAVVLAKLKESREERKEKLEEFFEQLEQRAKELGAK